jgi:hypothetical protein
MVEVVVGEIFGKLDQYFFRQYFCLAQQSFHVNNLGSNKDNGCRVNVKLLSFKIHDAVVKANHSVLLLLMLTMSWSAVSQQPIKPVYTFFLIGDAGKLAVSAMPYRDTLQYQIKNCSTSSSVIFLGDNVYPQGMPLKTNRERQKAESILRAQIDLAISGKSNNQIFFVPGNHDWKEGDEQGLDYILEAQRWFGSLAFKNVSMLPQNGCPGPIEISTTDSITLILLDTQWFLQKKRKPTGNSCMASTSDEVILQLDAILEKNKNKHIIVAGHHPVYTYGNHGGVFSLKQHIFPLTDFKKCLYIPLPVIGSAYPLYRKFFGNVQDVASPRYKAMRCALVNTFDKHPGLVYVSGHEHSLQYVLRKHVHFVVSGTGVNRTWVRKKGFSRFASSKNGYARLTVLSNGEMELEYFSGTSKTNTRSVFKKSLGR